MIYTEDCENNPNNLLFAMRRIYYFITRGYQFKSEELIKEVLEKFQHTEDFYRNFIIPVAVATLNNGENYKARKLLEVIPEDKRKLFAGFKAPWSIVLRLDRQISESQVMSWPEPLLDRKKLLAAHTKFFDDSAER